MVVLTSFFILAACSLVEAATYSESEGGTQFIFYNGTLGGTFSPQYDLGYAEDRVSASGAACKANHVFNFSGVAAEMHIGKNPDWDPNPFFFKLAQSPESGGFINNLVFSSTFYPCYKDGEPCGTLVFSPWYYITATMIDLNKAKTSRLTSPPLSSGETGTYYSVTGDEKTWASNDTVKWNTFDVNGYNQTGLRYCLAFLPSFFWNATTPFNYSLSFSNVTATMSLSISAPVAKLTFTFRGKRQDPSLDASNDTNAERGPEDVNGQYASIGLADPAQHPLPFFSFTNGTNFSWSHDSEHRYTATAGSAESCIPATWNTVAILGFMVWMLC